MPTRTVFAPPIEVVARWPNGPALAYGNETIIEPAYIDDAGRHTVLLILPITIIAIVFVGLRLIARVLNKTIGLDDLLTVIAMGPMVIVMFLICNLRNWGLGMHMWDAVATGLINARTAQDERLYMFLIALLLSISHIIARAAILTFLYRIFDHVGERHMRRALHAAAIFLLASSLVIIAADIFQCLPVQAFWDARVMKASCSQQRSFMVVGKLLNCLGNVALFALPLNRLWQIQVPLMNKIGLLFSFGIGLGICILSIVKMFYLGRLLFYDPLYDITWYYFPVAIICSWENCLTVICSCIPMLGFYFTSRARRTTGNGSAPAPPRPKTPASGSSSSPVPTPCSSRRSSWSPKAWARNNSIWSSESDEPAKEEKEEKSRWLFPPKKALGF